MFFRQLLKIALNTGTRSNSQGESKNLRNNELSSTYVHVIFQHTTTTTTTCPQPPQHFDLLFDKSVYRSNIFIQLLVAGQCTGDKYEIGSMREISNFNLIFNLILF